MSIASIVLIIQTRSLILILISLSYDLLESLEAYANRPLIEDIEGINKRLDYFKEIIHVF